MYRELEAQILEQLREGDLDQLRHLLGDHDLEIELLSGEWRLLFTELSDYYQVTDLDQRLARMAVSPDELSEFVATIRDPARQERWRPVSFGLAELADALPADSDLVGLVILEEADDWLWTEPVYELVAIRTEVFALLEPHMRALMLAGDFAALARLAEDHAEGCVEFSPEQWRVLLRHIRERVPELMSVFEARLAPPGDYTSIREALGHVADPRFQPSLEAWLRVHAPVSQYALYFRDASLERRDLDGSGLHTMPKRNTQPLRIVPPDERTAAPEAAPTQPDTEPVRTGDTMPFGIPLGPDEEDSTDDGAHVGDVVPDPTGIPPDDDETSSFSGHGPTSTLGGSGTA
ncbi:MAG: hypothetical protein IAG13_07140 [Deltaproteobacteria bacterium]|nr:hypothetical protein [Nannocystaceae bacterium]